MLSKEYGRAMDILTRDAEVLELVARRLLEKEVIERAELRDIMGAPPDRVEDEDRAPVCHASGNAAD